MNTLEIHLKVPCTQTSDQKFGYFLPITGQRPLLRVFKTVFSARIDFLCFVFWGKGLILQAPLCEAVKVVSERTKHTESVNPFELRTSSVLLRSQDCVHIYCYAWMVQLHNRKEFVRFSPPTNTVGMDLWIFIKHRTVLHLMVSKYRTGDGLSEYSR